jgi:hypothetical protein
VVPLWGRFFLPANGKGHEFSVFVGPVLAVLIWRYRRTLWQALPRAQQQPLLVVVLVSLLMGMGSLSTLEVPRGLSPFDLLRPLPGFRSIGVTGRYWCFLALPLSLFGAGALWTFLSRCPGGAKAAIVCGLALLTQLGAQTTALLSTVVTGRSYRPVEWTDSWKQDRPITFVLRGAHLQGELITPTRAVLDCYDEDDIPHAEMNPGTGLVRSVTLPEGSRLAGSKIRARFVTWSRILIDLDSPVEVSPSAAEESTVEVVLNQAYHHQWTAPGGTLSPSAHNNIVLRCNESRLGSGPVELSFHDPISRWGWNISRGAWGAWLVILSVLVVRRGTDRRWANPR